MPDINPSLLLAKDGPGFLKKAAMIFLESAASAIRERDRFCVALSGGSTPKKLFQLLSEPYYKERVDWSKTHIFWGDERCVPPNHPESNYAMAMETLLSKVPLGEDHIHRIPAEMDPPREAAKTYEQSLRAFFKSTTPPSFDLTLLGLGEDGHTASLFPKTAALQEKYHWVIPVYIEKFSAYRITLAFQVLNSSRLILFLVSGENKSGILKEVLRDDLPKNRYPAQLIKPVQGQLTWLFDRPAAAKLPADLKFKAYHLE